MAHDKGKRVEKLSVRDKGGLEELVRASEDMDFISIHSFFGL